jgi:hypothetical protein
LTAARGRCRQPRGASTTAKHQITAGESILKRYGPSNSRWEAFINTWATGDVAALDEEWMDYAADIDSPPEPYYEVRHIGFML